jgi:CRP-like cAMP-binding protein
MGTMTGASSASEDIREFLAGVFPSLDSEEIDELQRISLHVHYDEDELIAQEGSYASGVYVVGSGLVSIGKYASKGWEKRVLRFLAVGEMFGVEPVFLEREPINAEFAKAIVESSLVFFERSNILAFSKQHPRLFADLCRWLSREVIMLEFKLTREAVESMDRNLALLLMALANKYGEKTSEGVVLDLPISRQTMAEMLGISIETLMRALKRFRERNLIATSQSQITIIDFDSLKERARTSSFYLSIMEETL